MESLPGSVLPLTRVIKHFDSGFFNILIIIGHFSLIVSLSYMLTVHKKVTLVPFLYKDVSVQLRLIFLQMSGST